MHNACAFMKYETRNHVLTVLQKIITPHCEITSREQGTSLQKFTCNYTQNLSP